MEDAATTNHANRHVPKFLLLSDSSDCLESSWVQIVEDGKELTSQRLLQNKDVTLTKPILVKDTPGSIGMKTRSFAKREVTVRDIADIIGHHYPVHVIDVEHQEELEGWTLTDLVEYFEDEERLLYQHKKEMEKLAQSQTNRSRRRRKAAEKCMNRTANKPRVLNQISLEFSKTPLMERIASPQFVRELDWIDHAWPGFDERNEATEYPNVQYYCLTSAGGCYTDFHIDFGGTSVWYHILQGKKVFCLIPPTDQNLAAYEEWLCRADQNELFLPDMIQNQEEVLRLTLEAGQTMIIPAGYIHAVYTPADSVVLGGNFLHGMDIAMQLKIHCIEARTKVQEKFRFPFYLPLHFYAGGMYLKKLRDGTVSKREVEGLGELVYVLAEWWNVYALQSSVGKGPSVQSAAKYSAHQNGLETVEDFLKELQYEYTRVKEGGISPTTKKVGDLIKPNDAAVKSRPMIRLKLAAPSRISHQQVAERDASEDEPPKNSSNGNGSNDNSGGGVGGDISNRSNEEKKKPGRLRISLSLSATKAHPVAAKATVVPRKPKKVKREDTAWIVGETRDAEDDDWMPASRPKKRSKAKVAPSGSSDVAATGGKPSKASQINSESSRQRLLKRFR
eukprot:CAMPEP_0119548762 /NCGR_PEP_ID=MMETSP1352-20130426/2602_1 /TAXON_ID=265584 /ORGANISM="Stauroneis constricta, Strain CCMP1120" /LENGTH=617 /DNA_ID=CAMNT_0007594115 /DNA_START=83 /DNA_END=1936 /DNA_ORIENTATION=-